MTCGNNFLWLQVLSAAVSEVCFDHYWKQTRALNSTKNPWANPSSWLIIEHWEEATINNPWKKAKINRTADGQLLLRCWELNAVSVQKHCKRWELQSSETFIIRAETYSQNCRRAALFCCIVPRFCSKHTHMFKEPMTELFHHHLSYIKYFAYLTLREPKNMAMRQFSRQNVARWSDF